MAPKSLYCVECICGYYIESETNSLICPGCRRLVVIDWQNREQDDDRNEIRRRQRQTQHEARAR